MADASALTVGSSYPLHERRAYLGQNERQRLPGQYSDLTAEKLTGVLFKLQRGEVEQWADLVQFALKDDLLSHLCVTRTTRVSQADFQIVPNEFGNEHAAKLAAEFVNESISRIENWDEFISNLLHAIPLGYSANEIEWDRDGASRTTFVRNMHYINPNRFCYDEQWRLRLYDHGSRTISAKSLYGEPLMPGGWVVHTHHEIAGDPCDAGLMRMCIWRWLFRRWADTFWIQNLEKYGAPFVYAKVAPGTPEATRQLIKANIIDLSIERAAVFEAGGELVFEPPAMGTGQASQHQLYMDFAQTSLTATWLGASDVTQPGENGSQSAVGGRISATTDPRMIADGMKLCGTLQSQLFKWMIHYNLHKFGGVPPIPKMQFKTASDEQKTDLQDLATQNNADVNAGNAPYQVRGDAESPSLDGTLAQLPSGEAPIAALPADAGAPADPNAPPPPAAGEIKKQDTALNGAQVSSLLEIIQAVVDQRLPRGSAVAILQAAFNMDKATAELMLGTVGQGFEPAPDPAAAPPPFAKQPAAASPPPAQEPQDPKAQSRSHQERQTSQTTASQLKTSQTSLRSIGPLETVLRRISVDPHR